MSEIGIFCGSASGVTREVAEKLIEALGEDHCEYIDMEEDFTDFDMFMEYDYLLLGCSTWGAGEVQSDWRDPLFEIEMEKPDFSGKTVAVFGAGDFKDHGEHFVSALGILHDKFQERGATLVGAFPTDGYTYENSFAERDGKFVGLGIDKVNEADKTDERVARWVEILKEHFPHD